MGDDEPFETKPTYEQILAENIRLRQHIATLESGNATLVAEAQVKKPSLHRLDPNAKDAFQRPAYSRRPK